MSRVWWYALAVHVVLALVLVVRVLRRRREPVAMVAWIFAIVTLPGLGAFCYWVLASNRLRRKVKRRQRRVAALLGRLEDRGPRRVRLLGDGGTVELSAELQGIEQLAQRLGDMPATGGNRVRFLTEADATYAALERAMRDAREHINLEYYIWRDDETGRAFRDLLCERAAAGVKCRLLLDAVGCWQLGRGFVRSLVEAGVRVAFFMPIHPFPLRKRWSMHLRNHRKIAVVDGVTALVGSQNVGDEYRGRLKRLSPWYDTHMRIDGPAALLLQQVFAEDWYIAARERLDHDAYFPRPQMCGESVVQVLPSGPDMGVSALGQVLFAAVSAARESVRIATPYFVPDGALRWALTYACYRGVQVRLVLPTRSDSQLALWAARSFYPELVDAGVEIHEYEAGVLHSKLVTVDESWGMLGSANMDARSFRLNFEVTALIYDSDVVGEMVRYIDDYCGQARRVSQREVWQRGLVRQVGEGAARLFAPLL